FIYGNILIEADLRKAFSKGFDAFIHLAAFKAAGESMIIPEKYSVNNITGTLNILNVAMEYNCKNMVFSSSAAIFGEPKYIPIDEDHPKNPENYYGYTKLSIEDYMEWYSKLKGLNYAALRYFNAAGYDVDGVLYGLEQNPANLLPIIMETACGMRPKMKIFGDDYDTPDGTCIRDYVHVTDLAIAHVKALEYISSRNENIKLNLGSETGTSVKEMVDAARRITGKEIPADIVERRPGDPANLVASSTKAFETIGWKAAYSDVDTLIATTWNAYKKYNHIG
ncbi:MAG: UDP-glucose 4-epimerase GalE, partial [Treponema sp.]|nr:UDP-glucose 4-epimerase GalE [Treponema sp.]